MADFDTGNIVNTFVHAAHDCTITEHASAAECSASAASDRLQKIALIACSWTARSSSDGTNAAMHVATPEASTRTVAIVATAALQLP